VTAPGENGVPRPAAVVFDVNETLSDLSPLAARFAEIGAPEHLAATWFAGVLRDGFALTAVGAAQPFAAVAEGVLQGLLAGIDLRRDRAAAVEHVLAGFPDLPVHPDVVAGVRALHAAGVRLVTLTNGSTGVSGALLRGAGIDDCFEHVLSVEDAGAWKPARRAYEHALHRLDLPASAAMLVAVHPWDVDGAARAGLRTAWVDRAGTPYPGHFTAPELHVRGIDHLAARLTG
jgi:2-haloacid dehalogenase